jgi:hypothetical protein
VRAAGLIPCLLEMVASACPRLPDPHLTLTPLPPTIHTQVAAVCAAGLIPRLLEMVASEDFEVRKEAAYALCNACCSGSAEAVRWLAQVRTFHHRILCPIY